MTDSKLERMVANLLRVGVLISGSVVLAGGIYYLARHGSEPVDYRRFQQEPIAYRSVTKILAGAWGLSARSIIQFGVLLLIATPIARVILSLVGFAIERDRTYVLITSVVLTLLLFGLAQGGL